MSYLHLAYLHLATVLPAAAIGAALLCMRKGTRMHRTFGRVFMVLMLVTAAVSLFMPAKVGGQFLGHFGGIHLLSLLVLVSAPQAWRAARRGDIRTHRNAVVGVYIGMIVAGVFALAPGRLLHGFLLGG